LLAAVVGMLGIGLGYPGQPHVLVRFMAIRRPRDVRKGALITVIWSILSLYGAVMVGLAAKALLSTDPGDPERVMPLLAIQVLPAWLAGAMIAAAMAAMMSTADSMLLVAAASIVQDFYHKLFGRGVSERKLVRVSRLVTLLIGAVAFVLALSQDPNATGGVVFWLVLFAWGGLGASFGPLLILSLYWKRVTRAGAYAGITSGALTVLIWHYIPALSSALYELVPAFFVSLAAVYFVSLATAPPSQTVRDKVSDACRPLAWERATASAARRSPLDEASYFGRSPSLAASSSLEETSSFDAARCFARIRLLKGRWPSPTPIPSPAR
jgi:sodium/proline symporter